MYRFLRNPKTTQERKQIYNCEEQGIKVRGKRRHNKLPNAWDDIWVRSLERSWKSKRKTQYKCKPL